MNIEYWYIINRKLSWVVHFLWNMKGGIKKFPPIRQLHTQLLIWLITIYREGYIESMSEHVNIHIYGNCGAPCPGDTPLGCLQYHLGWLRRGLRMTLIDQNKSYSCLVMSRSWSAISPFSDQVSVISGNCLPKGETIQSFSAFTSGMKVGKNLCASSKRSFRFRLSFPPDDIPPPSFLRTSGDITKPFPRSHQINWHQFSRCKLLALHTHWCQP